MVSQKRWYLFKRFLSKNGYIDYVCIWFQRELRTQNPETNPEKDPENPETDQENPDIDSDNPETDPDNPEADPENQ